VAAWSPAAVGGADAEAPGARPESKSNPQDSQNRPDLAVPHSGQGPAGAAGCGDDGGAPPGVTAGPADAPIRIPQTWQKSLLAES
jgi:hypothetical protein